MVYVKIIQDAVDIIETCKPVPTNFLLPRFSIANCKYLVESPLRGNTITKMLWYFGTYPIAMLICDIAAFIIL